MQASIGSFGRLTKRTMTRAASGLLVLLATPALAQAPKIGDPPEARNMRLAGYNDLQARSAYQPVIHRQGSRYIAYVGHHGGTQAAPKPVNPLNGQAEFNGTSIIDVTDPKQPKYLAHIPGMEGLGEQGGGQMVRLCDGSTLPKGDPNMVYLLRTFGGQAHEIWNVADPTNPKLLSAPAERQGHPQELVGMRDRHRLPGLGSGKLAHPANDRGL